jgi:hypothetical protein
MAREMEIQILGMDSMDPGMMMAQAEAEGAIGDLRDMEEAEFEAMAPQGDLLVKCLIWRPTLIFLRA